MSYFIDCPYKDCIHRNVCNKQIKIEMCKVECIHYNNDISFIEKIGKKYMNIKNNQ